MHAPLVCRYFVRSVVDDVSCINRFCFASVCVPSPRTNVHVSNNFDANSQFYRQNICQRFKARQFLISLQLISIRFLVGRLYGSRSSIDSTSCGTALPKSS